jgi:hypothetical protein
MGEKLQLLVIGWLLTGVLGALIAAGIQRYTWNRQHEAQQRDWEHQNEVQKRDWEHQYMVQQRDEERQQALKTFEDISTLLDKRLYRMWRLHWAIKKKARGASNEKEMDLARTAYRDVLYEWNDNLNRTLALAQTYFGDGVRQTLEGSLYEAVAALGRALDATEQMVSKAENKPVDIPQLSGRLTRLSRRIYEMNVHMLSLLEENRLGEARLEARMKPSLPITERMLEIGDQGGAVGYLQRALNRTGQVNINVDGLFGPDTWSAVRVFQDSHNLDADGIVGPKTWAALPLEEPTLQMGNRGDHVRRLQQALNRAGVMDISVDGIFGSDTLSAVRAFQSSHNLDADGIVGPKTWTALL